MTDQLPGITVHLHEGRLNGIFELPAADMPYISYQGRVMLVLLADAVKCNIADTKDGDTKASWVFKACDAAVVREESMREHLSKTLYLDDETFDPFAGNTQESWKLEVDPADLGTVTVDPPVGVDEETGEILEEEEEEEEREPLFQPKQRTVSTYNGNGIQNDVGTVETIGAPIRYKDKTLAGFMRGEGDES